MALINCSECDRMASDQAAACLLLTSLMLDAEKVHLCELYSGKDEDWSLKSV